MYAGYWGGERRGLALIFSFICCNMCIVCVLNRSFMYLCLRFSLNCYLSQIWFRFILQFRICLFVYKLLQTNFYSNHAKNWLKGSSVNLLNSSTHSTTSRVFCWLICKFKHNLASLGMLVNGTIIHQIMNCGNNGNSEEAKDLINTLRKFKLIKRR